MSDGNKMTVIVPEDRDDTIILKRTFNAPKELVYKTMLDPKLIAQWWGPASDQTEVIEMNPVEGGKWRFSTNVDMGGGAKLVFFGEFRELVPFDKIVQTFNFEPGPSAESVETSVLEEVDGKTTIINTAVYPTKEARDAMIASGMESGAAETWDRFAALLEKEMQK